MNHKNQSFFIRLKFAFDGITAAFKKESSFRIQFLGLAFVIAFCLITRPPALWCAIFLCLCALVISLELINTAIEAILDNLHPQFDPAIGFAKDCLAGAVLVSSLTSVVVFLIYIFSLN